MAIWKKLTSANLPSNKPTILINMDLIISIKESDLQEHTILVGADGEGILVKETIDQLTKVPNYTTL